ncbi:MAG: cytochrome c [Thiohalobacteraceae bacterium]
MFSTVRTRILVPLVLAGIAAPLLAAPVDAVRTRMAGYRDLGAQFKALNDGLRASSPQPAALRTPAAKIRDAATRQYHWFPAGSGPRAGVKTAAKPEIWTQGARFRELQNTFATRATALERAVAGGNLATMRSATRSLGATCKGCHDQFRSDEK